MRSSVRGNLVRTAAGNAVYAACQWGIVAVLARMSTPEVVGQYALAVAFTTPIFMLSQLNLRSVLATDAAGERGFRDYRRLRCVTTAAGLAAILIWAALFYGATEARIIALVGLIQACEWLSDIHHGLFQQHERMGRIAVSLAARGLLGVAGMAAVMAVTHSLIAALLAVLGGRLAVLALCDMRWAAGASEGRASVGSLLMTALPLGFVMMMCSYVTNVPRYFIAHELGNAQLGIFSAAASLTTAGSLFVNALGQAATPRMARLYCEGDLKAFRRLTARMLGLGVALGAAGVAGAALAGRWALAVLFTPEYAKRADVLIVLAVVAGAGYLSSLLGYAITACRRFRQQAPLQAASIAVVALACLELVPRYGLSGAAAAIGAGQLVQAVWELAILRAALAGNRPVLIPVRLDAEAAL